MSHGGAYLSKVYHFGDLVALTLMHEDSDGNSDGRTHYLQPAHAIRTASLLIKAALAQVEGEDFPSTDALATGTELHTAIDEVVQLIDREAMGAGNMSSRDRHILQQIIDGVTEQEREDRTTELQHLTVALADDDGRGLGKYALGQALEIINENLHMDHGAADVSDRAQAEVWPSIDGPRNGGSAFAWPEEGADDD